MITYRTLEALSPKGKPDLMAKLAPVLDRSLKGWSHLRVAHFLAQIAHESGGFTTMQERGGPSYWKRYEGRKDLGNVNPGDGVKFHGRGPIQITGRANYLEFGRMLGLDLVNNPDRVLEPTVGVEVAVAYWKKRKLDAWADRDDVKEITRRINGGYNGLDERKAYLRRAKQIIPPDPVPAEPSEDIAPDAPAAVEPSKKWWESTTVLATLTGAVTGLGTAVNTLVQGIDTPWEVAGLVAVIVVIGGCAAWVIRERMRKEPG